MRRRDNVCLPATAIAALMALGLSILPAAAQDDMNRLRQLWKSDQYSDAVVLAAQIRDQLFGRTAELDYIVATSLCRLPGHAAEGKSYFDWCLEYYHLDDHSIAVIDSERQACSEAAVTAAPKVIGVMTTKGSAISGTGVSGKLFHNPNETIRSTPLEIVAPKSAEELKARLTPASEPDSAARKIARLAGTKFSVQAYGRFVIANASPNADLPETQRRLDVYGEFFASEYGLTLPPYLITVYLVPTVKQLDALALKLHGFKLPSAAIGYSFRDDLSLLAFCPDRTTSTLYHELFHLMARSTFGDIPPWLDEGMAALYEVSRIEGRRAVGVNNWRGRILQELWHQRPTIEQLVNMDWPTFDKIEHDDEAGSQAVNHATARYFMQYLQDQGKLSEVCNTMRRRQPKDLLQGDEARPVRVLEKILQQPIAQIESNFAGWFKAKPRW